MILADPMDFTWTSTPIPAGGNHPRGSRYRYQYAAHTIYRLLILFVGL